MRRGLGEIVFWFFNRRIRPSVSAVRLDPNIPIVHQLNLPLDHLLAVLGMFHRDASSTGGFARKDEWSRRLSRKVGMVRNNVVAAGMEDQGFSVRPAVFLHLAQKDIVIPAVEAPKLPANQPGSHSLQ